MRTASQGLACSRAPEKAPCTHTLALPTERARDPGRHVPPWLGSHGGDVALGHRSGAWTDA